MSSEMALRTEIVKDYGKCMEKIREDKFLSTSVNPGRRNVSCVVGA